VNIVLICHGAEENSKEPETCPLSKGGREEVDRLKDTLVSLGLQPEVFLMSYGYKSVNETAELLSAGTSKPVPIKALKPLDKTQHTIKDVLEKMVVAHLSRMARSRL
jgi:phosphohistidine phosphatase SixA